MADNDYCENCGGDCDGCCAGPDKKFPTKQEQAREIVKMIMSHGHFMANLVLKELNAKLLAPQEEGCE
jgi:hypothetical protein